MPDRRWLRTTRRSQHTSAAYGAVLGAAIVLFVTLTAIGSSRSSVLVLAEIAVPMVIALVLLALLPPWERLPRWLLLIFPTLIITAIGVLAMAIGPFATSYAGLMVLAYLYVGLTQPPWRSVWLLPLSLGAYLLIFSQADLSVILIRFPIAMVVWISVAEVSAVHASLMRREASRLTLEADIDVLTGLFNRRALPSVLDRMSEGDAVLLIDLDHFKRINDDLGHDVGDVVLEQFGRAVRYQLRSEDIAVRYGGEEILVLLARGGLHGGRQYDLRLRGAVTLIEPTVDFSAGLVVAAAGEDGPAVLARADRALYRAKAAGRGRTTSETAPVIRADDLL